MAWKQCEGQRNETQDREYSIESYVFKLTVWLEDTVPHKGAVPTYLPLRYLPK